MLGDTADSRTFAMATFVGHSFLNSTHSLDSHNITLLVDSHVCGQRNNSTFSKRPRGHSAGVPPLPLCVAYFGKLLEDGGSSWKAGNILMDREIISFLPEFGNLKEVIKTYGMVPEHWAVEWRGESTAAPPTTHPLPPEGWQHWSRWAQAMASRATQLQIAPGSKKLLLKYPSFLL